MILTKKEKINLDIYICSFCGCEFIYIGGCNLQGKNGSIIKYCSELCYKLASNEKNKKHRLKTLGTTDLSEKRIKNFKKEARRIRREKKILHLI